MTLLGYRSLNTNRKHSRALWGDAPVKEVIRGFKDGIYFHDDFVGGPTCPETTVSDTVTIGQGRYRVYASTGGSVAQTDLTTFGGAVTLASNDADEGAAIQQNTCPFLICLTGGDLWFEARIKAPSITDTAGGFFLGLMEPSVLGETIPIAAAGTMADANFVGFQRLEGDSDVLDVTYKANGVAQGVLVADAVTLVADTWIKVGLRYKRSTGKLSYWINGVEASTMYSLTSTAGNPFPNDVNLGLTFTVLNHSGNKGGASIDWWSCLQLDAGE